MENQKSSNCSLNRRDFISAAVTGIAGLSLSAMNPCSVMAEIFKSVPKIKPCGPASKYTPKIKVGFVKREGEYGMWWPGAVYDGKAAMKKYKTQLQDYADQIGAELDITTEPLTSVVKADKWLESAKAKDIDGRVLLVMDRQEHAWPTAYKAAKDEVPTVIFTPLGCAFTDNTKGMVNMKNSVVYAGTDLSEALYGLKMLYTSAKMRKTRCLVIHNKGRFTTPLGDTGITLEYITADDYLDIYSKMSLTPQVKDMVNDCLKKAKTCHSKNAASKQDVINGAKAYFTLKQLVEKYQVDALTMACLNVLPYSKISLPCLAFSKMNDDGFPAICEADHGAVASQIIVQHLFDRPGFQQDPTPNTADDSIIGAHCTCATKLAGFDKPSEPFDIVHHHGCRDATIRTEWKVGQRVTCLDVLPPAKDSKGQSEFLISAGTVLENISTPPHGGCVVSVNVKFDGGHEVRNFPGFHQVFFYGDYKKQLKEFCKLFDYKSTIV